MFPWLLSAALVMQTPADSIKKLDEVVVQSYHARQSLVQVAAPIAVLSPQLVPLFDQNSPLSLLNSVPGVRMESGPPEVFGCPSADLRFGRRLGYVTSKYIGKVFPSPMRLEIPS